MITLSNEQVQQLAPDDASLKAAKGLGLGKWTELSYNDEALWGLCQGSGKTPYQSAVDTRDFVAKCSCPSRKFPCKHALALMLHYVGSKEKFKESAEMPSWISDWLNKRGDAQAKKAERAEKAADPKAQKKRQAARHQKASAGLLDLQLWLRDFIRNGLLQVEQDYDNVTQSLMTLNKRMIDAQLPGLAQQLFELANLPKGQPQDFLYRLSHLYAQSKAYQKIDNLDEDWKNEIRLRLGFPFSKEEVLQGPAIVDHWLSLGKIVETLERGDNHLYYFYGLKTRRFAVLIDFILGKQKMHSDFSIVLGACYRGELCFYPGVENTRALPKAWQLSSKLPAEWQPAPEALSELWSALLERYARNPLQRYHLMLVPQVRLLRSERQWALSDGEHLLPFSSDERQKMKLLAGSLGRPFSAFVLFDAYQQSKHILSFFTPQQHLELLS